jgi:hypothetical protein
MVVVTVMVVGAAGMRIIVPKSSLQADNDWFILRPFKPSLWLALLGTGKVNEYAMLFDVYAWRSHDIRLRLHVMACALNFPRLVFSVNLSVLGMACIFHAIDKVSPYGKRTENAPNWLYHVSWLLGGDGGEGIYSEADRHRHDRRDGCCPLAAMQALGGGLLNIDAFRTINHQGVASSILTLAWTFAALATVTLYTANMYVRP